MINICVDARAARVDKLEKLTSGSMGVLTGFVFSPDWDGLSRWAIFSNGTVERDVLLSGDFCEVPSECMATPGAVLTVGLYGADTDLNVVIPTVICNLGKIEPGAELSGYDPEDITPGVIEQLSTAVQQAINTAQSVRDEADAGDFNGVNGVDGQDGEDGYSPAVTITRITGGHRLTITDKIHPVGQNVEVMDGEQGMPGAPGASGEDGFSPAVTVANITGGHRLTITDKAHPSGQNVDIMDGAPGTPGADGEDGFSPVVTVTDIAGGHRVTITDAEGPHVFDVMDGQGGSGAVSSVNGKVGDVVLGAEDVGALPDDTLIPTTFADLTGDATHRTVTDAEKSVWNSKQGAISDLATIRSGAALGATALQSFTESDPVFIASAAHGITSADIASWNGKGTYSKPSGGIPKTDLASSVQSSLGKADTAVQSDDLAAVATTGSYNDLLNTPTVPTSLSQLSADSTHRLVTDAEKNVWGGKQDALGFTPYNATNPAGYQTAAQVSAAVSSGVSGKENKGKITISGTEKTATSHTVTIVTNGTTTTLTLVGVS